MWDLVNVLQMENVEHRYQAEKLYTQQELEARKVDVKERLIADYEEKKRQVENDRLHMELSAGEWLDISRAHRAPHDSRKPMHVIVLTTDWHCHRTT